MAYIPPNKRRAMAEAANSTNTVNATVSTNASVNYDESNDYNDYQRKQSSRSQYGQYSQSRSRNDNSYSESKRRNYDNDEYDTQSDELQTAYRRQLEQINELTTENRNLKSELESIQSKLNVYTSKDPKVSKSEFDALNAKFEEYKRVKYNEFKSFKEKLDNHNDEVLQLNRELKQFEDKLKKSELEAQRWKSSFQESQAKLKAQLQKEKVLKPAPKPVEQLDQPAPKLEDEHFIQDDWNGIIQAVDFVLSLDKKAIPRQLNIPALKYTRQLLNAHQ